MNKTLVAYINSLDIRGISQERRTLLDKVKKYILHKSEVGKPVKLNFICTHNSRRSQFGQIWAQAIGRCYNIAIETFSGGVEVTAFNHTAVKTLENAGFQSLKTGEINPVYELVYDANESAIKAYSKLYDDPANPSEDFAAIMTCSHADENCPLIIGAEERISLTYEDPKQADGTPEETSVYEERSKQIATEMNYIFSSLKG